MADATSGFDRLPPPRSAPPRDWSQAFAALPQEAPPGDAWPALAAHLQRKVDARQHRIRRAGFALAAGVASIAAGMVLWFSLHSPAPTPANGLAQHAAQSAAQHAAQHAAQPDATRGPDASSEAPQVAGTGDAQPSRIAVLPIAVQNPGARGDAEPAVLPGNAGAEAAVPRLADADGASSVASAARWMSVPGPRRGERPRRATLPRLPSVEPLSLPVERRLADNGPAPPPADASMRDARISSDALSPDAPPTFASAESAMPSTSATSAAAPASPIARDAEMRQLQTRSVQLEVWLERLRDPSVGTGPGALLAAELDDRLAGIDAALATVSTEGGDIQRELWRARVSALQRTLAFETRLRTLAAEGRDYDGALVTVD